MPSKFQLVMLYSMKIEKTKIKSFSFDISLFYFVNE